MLLTERFQNNIHQFNLFSSKDKLLLAVSGGLDSVVLCELCRQSGFAFTIAHCNFHLRGEESDRDEQFVKSLGDKYGTTVLVKQFDTASYVKEKSVSVQVAARELRYAWFAELLNDRAKTYSHLLTAHHLNDNIETVLMNFFKGTGITGMRGILPRQGKIVRPLLFAGKEELLAFANKQWLNWVEDSSNESDKYSRNYLRHQLIPVVQKIYPEAEKNLAANIQRFSDVDLLYQQAIAIHKKKLIEQKGNEFHIPVLKLKKSVPLSSILYEIAKDFGFHAAQTNELVDLLDSGSGKYVASSTHRIIMNRNWLIIAPLANKEAAIILIEEGVNKLAFAAGHLLFDTVSAAGYNLQTANTIALLDADEIKFPLLLRQWKEGDYFYPLGMKKKKKLARFFIDQKLSKTDKEKVWVVEMNKKIIWVVGQRIDDRFKVTGITKNILQINFQPVSG